MDGGGIEGYVDGMGGAEEVETWIVMYIIRKDSLLSFLKKLKINLKRKQNNALLGHGIPDIHINSKYLCVLH